MNSTCLHHTDSERRQTGDPCPVCQKLEIDQLRNWQAQAMFVETEWDEQAIAKMLGAKPGESCRKVIQKRVPEILGELDMANDALHEARLALGSHDKPFICDAIRSLLEKLEAANQDAERLAVCLQALEGDCDIGSLARRALAMHETRTN